jgi:hypothetical protein
VNHVILTVSTDFISNRRSLGIASNIAMVWEEALIHSTARGACEFNFKIREHDVAGVDLIKPPFLTPRRRAVNS